MKTKLTSVISSLIFFLFLFSVSIADTLIMNDGSILKGTVIQQEKNTLKFKTNYAGMLNIKWKQVKSLKTDKPVKIMLVTDELMTANKVNNLSNDISQIKKEDKQDYTEFQTHNISYINPDPWRLGKGYKFSGRVNASLKSQHGNTTKNEFDIDGELTLRSLKDRYSFVGQLEHDRTDKKTSSDNWILHNEYHYFTSKTRYLGALVYFERDRFTDLNLRTLVGPIIGKQHYESTDLNLATSVGIVKAYEDNIVSKNTDYMGTVWSINYDHFLFDKWTQFYHRHTGLWDWEKTEKVTLDSWTGFRFPLSSGLIASVEIEWEYDSVPKETIHKSDTTYRFKLGYHW
ncbi:MAG: DUF481 domain-containing protein [Gammaproteobacteria bacterium]|nr:DUF481 domain-containing protein [Gammaproteobacteria bacterium]